MRDLEKSKEKGERGSWKTKGKGFEVRKIENCGGVKDWDWGDGEVEGG